MDDRIKKAIYFVLFVLFVVAAAIAIYFVFFRGAAPETPTDEPPVIIDEVTGLPVSGLGQPTITPTTGEETIQILPVSEVARGGLTETTTLTASAVGAINLAGDGQAMNYYNPVDGKFYTVNADGTITPLSAQTFPYAEDVEWNSQGDKAVIEFPDGSNIVYDFETQEQFTLPSHWEEFEFSPTSDEIAAKSIGLDPGNRWVVVTNSDGSNTQTAFALGENADKVTLSWSPNDQVIAFSATGPTQTGFGREMILPIGMNDENFKGLVVEGLGFQSIWSTSGDRILYSVYTAESDYNPTLWLVDGSGSNIGNNRRSVGLQTWADKCVFADNRTIYCAVPQELPSGGALQRSLVENSPDNLYKIDATTGQVTFIGTPASAQPMENLTVSEDGKYLYYTNGISNILNYMLLK